MPSDLGAILRKVAEEDYKREIRKVEEGLERYKSLILKIAEAKKWDLSVWIEGTELRDLKKYEKDLNLLEKAKLIKGHMKYTERNAYREYQLTKKGNGLVKKLLKET